MNTAPFEVKKLAYNTTSFLLNHGVLTLTELSVFLFISKVNIHYLPLKDKKKDASNASELTIYIY